MTERLYIKNNLHQLELLSGFLDKVAARFGLDQSVVLQLQLVLEETMINIIFYAFPDKTSQTIGVTIQKNGTCLCVTVEDEGIPFDPTKKKDPDISLPAADRPVGGLGIYLIKQIMTVVEYRRVGNKNILTMIKQLPG